MKWGIIEISKELIAQWRAEDNTVFEKLYPMGFEMTIELESTRGSVLFAFKHKECDYNSYYDAVFETQDDGSIKFVKLNGCVNKERFFIDEVRESSNPEP